MKAFQQILVSTAFALAIYPLAAQTGSAPDEREENRRKLERLKDQPEEMAKIRNKAIFFLSLPEDRRAQLLDLDRRLQKEPLSSRKRLEKVLERYTTWLEGLDSVQQKKIKDASDSKTRLEIIKTIRAQQWLKRQPDALQKELAKMDGAKRAAKIRALREQERGKKVVWLISSRFWSKLDKSQAMPAKLGDFGDNVTSFVNEYLLPQLDNREKERLRTAEGKWPLYPMTLVALADRHPPALPDKEWPRNFKELPKDVQKKIVRMKDGNPKIPGKFFQQAKREGFARAASQWTRKGPPFPHELWPKNKAALSDPVKKFISTKLDQVLTTEEFKKLNHAEDQGWPSYPLMLNKLAQDHDLQVPWYILPGDPETWDDYRLQKRLPPRK